MDNFLSKERVLDSLWFAYKKTSDYKSGYKDGIPTNNIIVIKQEKEGLKGIYTNFFNKLFSYKNVKDEFKNRTIGDWVREWKEMHKELFKFILKNRGSYRQEEVRFGSPGDEELYKFPLAIAVPSEVNQLAHTLNKEYLVDSNISDDEKLCILAKFHYQFIRIHPFSDGNGRIARAITDQLAVFFDFPPAMAGYPRLDPKRRVNYHTAIRACVEDPECTKLSFWIRSYIDRRLSTLA